MAPLPGNQRPTLPRYQPEGEFTDSGETPRNRRIVRAATAACFLADFTFMALCLAALDAASGRAAAQSAASLRIACSALVFVLLLLTLKMYRPDMWSPPHARMIRALLVALALPPCLALFGLLPPGPSRIPALAAASLCALVVALGTRQLVSAFSLWRPRGPDRQINVLVAGSNQRTQALVRAALDDPKRRYRVLGLVDDRDLHAFPGMPQVRLVASIDGLPDYLRSNVVDEVVLSLPLRSMLDRAESVLDHCMEQGIQVSLLDEPPGPNGPVPGNLSWEDLVKPVYAPTLNNDQTVQKRIMDLSLAVPFALLALPVALLAAAAIKLTSPGPVLFVQNRVGLGKRLFRFYKLRTMVADAEALQRRLEHLNEADGGAFKIRHDPRITPVGRFLRRYSIDELPQIINVLRGEMSLVGPRPLPVRDLEKMTENWACTRFTVLPGLTCLWQTNGRLDIPFDQWMRMDMEYIANWSLLLDLKILLKTVPAVFSGRGAY